MTFKTKIRLLGIMAMAGVILFFSAIYHGQVNRYQGQVYVQAMILSSEYLSELAHELQKERGIASGFIATHSTEDLERLKSQFVRVDQAAKKFGTEGFEGVNHYLNLESLRELVISTEANLALVIELYSEIIQSILDKIFSLAVLVDSSEIKNDLFALSHLTQAKEYLGRIRAELYNHLKSGGSDAETGYNIARLESLHQNHIQLFYRDAHQDIAEYLKHTQTGVSYIRTMEIVRQAAGPELMNLDESSAAWFDLATRSIDEFKRSEVRARTITKQKSGELLESSRNKIIRISLIAFSIGLIITIFTLVIVRRLVNNIRKLESGVNMIVESGDFSKRIDVADVKNEIAYVAKGFNKLLVVAENLMLEKESQAKTDVLTGIPNRLHFNEKLTRELKRKKRYPGPVSLIILDIDRFKRINDDFGHNAGDNVLKELSNLIRQNVREVDFVARWGGEEFIILMPDSPEEAGGKLAEKLRDILDKHTFPFVGKVTASFGVASMYPEDTIVSLVNRADKALYLAKDRGRNRVEISPEFFTST